MKNWKFVKTGNGISLSGFGGEIPPESELSKEIYSELKNNGFDKDKVVLSLAVKYKSIPNARGFFESAVEKVMRSYSNRTVNESIDKQTWSMFKGLSKDAEKEVGNAYTPNPELLKVLEAWLHNRMSEQEARAKIMKITGDKNITDMMIHSPGGFIPAGNKKTGNESIGDEYNAEIYRLEKKKMDLERMGQGQKAREIEKQIQQLQKELREYDIGNKKVWNAFDAGIHLTIRYNGKEEEVKVLKDMPTSVVVKGQNGAVVEIKKVDLDVLKVHNAKPGSIASIGPAWMHGGTVYGKMDTDESGKRHNEYVKITWLGEGKGGVANYFIDDRMQSDKFGSLDKNELKRWAESKIGNSTWSEPRKMPFQQKSLKYAYEKAKGNGLSGKRLEEEMLRIAKTLPHESSATEEEKKKDVSEWILRNGSREDFVNNLARARNAMNKKVKNSSVREYKDSEGRIAQIDFDSDGTDADMSIYEDERMTRAVESKNFSTIRDAEQYVQSHGFRRVG